VGSTTLRGHHKGRSASRGPVHGYTQQLDLCKLTGGESMGGAIGMILGNWLLGGASTVICLIALIMVIGNVLGKKK
jgi:hypothetical protein